MFLCILAEDLNLHFLQLQKSLRDCSSDFLVYVVHQISQVFLNGVSNENFEVECTIE